MNSETRQYIRYRMRRGQESLDEAISLCDDGHLHGTVNRMYYACFYVVSALLLTEGLHSKKHSGVIAIFIRHWTKNGRLPVEMGDFLRTLFDHRQQGDYRDLLDFEPSDVEKWLNQAREFIAKIGKQIEEQLQTPEDETS